MLACVVVSVYKSVLLISSRSIAWFALSNSLTDGVIALVELYFYRKQNGQKLRFSISTGKEILAESYHFIISGIMVALYTQMDRIMIGYMMTDMDVGLYTTAASLCSLWVFVPTAIINSFRPMIMETKKSGNESLYLLRLKQLYSGVIWLCIAVSSLIFILADFVIFLLYGSDYLGAVGTLRIIIWSETFAMIGTARGIWILCERKNKYVKHYLLWGSIVNLILNYILIPMYGINGAAVATLITQIVTSMVAPLLFSETRVHTRLVIESFCVQWMCKK